MDQQETIDQLTLENEELRKQNKANEQRIAELETLLKTFQAKLFGTKSEKSASSDKNQLTLWDDNSVFTWSEHTDEQSAESSQKKVQKSQKKWQKRQGQIEGLAIVKEVKRRAEKTCPFGQALKVVGAKFVGKKLHYKPAELWVVEEYVETYTCACADCLAQNNGQTAFFSAAKTTSLFPHSLATPTLLENIVYQKYALGTPLYRQLKDWHRFGWNVCESTLAAWVIHGADKLRSLYDLLHQKLLQRPYLQGDETVVKVLREPGKKPTAESRMWVQRTVQKDERQAIYYAYRPDRSEKSACSLYSGFTGVLQCDGYQVYPKVACTDRVGCLAHVRRKFFEAAKYSQTAKGPLKILDQIFHLEKKWASLSSSARMSKRNEFLRPLFEKFWQTLATCATLPKSLLGKAIAYALGQKEAINKLLQYGAIDISNNTCEQAVKSLVIDRKNFLFSTSVAGADANAIWLTLIESAKANGLDPQKYLTKILTLVPRLGPFPTEKELEAYLPWN
ncbi:IS66 family transposase [Ligilactobacillus acidipiscis]|uniref:IS66 family transposase n=1 Tax=Ligilactobacillus acidipiscis TaxID=89059 RepID=UPI0038630930